MATTTKLPRVARATGPRYYRTFASYHIPFRPVDEWDYAKTEGAAAYCVAYHDASERIVRFTKVRLVRPIKEPRDVNLRSPAIPGATVYFVDLCGDEGGQGVGEQITYADTAERATYWTGTVAPGGRSAPVVRLEKQQTFTDVYTYWPTGRLRERWATQPGQPSAAAFYDRNGNQIEERIPFDGSVVFDAGRGELNAGRYREARELLTQALALGEQEEYLHGVAKALNLLARADLGLARHAPPAQKRDRAAAAVAAVKRAFPLWQALDNTNGEMSAWYSFGIAERIVAQASRDEGDADDATRRYETARRCFQNIIPLGKRGGEWQNVLDAYAALSDLANEFEQAQDAADANEGIETTQRHLAAVPAG